MQNPKMSNTTSDFQRRVKLVEERLQKDSNEAERKFLDAAEVGDKDLLIEVVESGDVSVEVVNLSGRTALELAVDGNNVEIVEYLLPKCSKLTVHRGLLCAVENDRNFIFDLILQHPMYHEKKDASTEKEKLEASFQAADMEALEATDGLSMDAASLLRDALVQAAIECNFTIVRTVVLEGAYIEPPHAYFCICARCTTQKSDDMMQYTKERLSTYRALASPAYISATEKDPIIGAFKLSSQFKKLAGIETEYSQTYLDLDQQCQQFAIGLIDQCRSSVEVSKVLSGRVTGLDGDSDSEPDDEADMLPVLKLAMRLQQKRFVAHASCQAQIAQLWFSGVPALRYLNRFGYLMAAIPVGMVVIPFMSLIYIFFPWTKVTSILNTPIMRFVSFTCSYISYLVFVMVAKLNFGMTMDMVGCDAVNSVQQGVFGFLIIWLIALIWQESKQIWEAGGKEYFFSFWNVMDTIMLSLYLCTFSLELIGPRVLRNLYRRREAETGLGEPEYCQTLRDAEDLCVIRNEGQRLEISWDPSWVPDPSLLSDMTFSVAILMSISRSSFIMPSNEQFGTMLVSFQRTMGDILKLCSMFILVLLAFSFGMTVLYGAEACNNAQFNGLIESMRTLVWSMMGMGDSAATDIESDGTFPIRVAIIANIGSVMFMVFIFATAVVLMNLLIAMMANTFQEIQDEREVEWKFGRTELWLSFIEPGNPVSPPFNLIPSMASILQCCSWLNSRVGGETKDPVLVKKPKSDNLRKVSTVNSRLGG